MFKSLDILKDMEVVGLDGNHVGTVDHLEAADRIILSKDDPKAGGRQHLISIDWVDYVDQKAHLNNSSTKQTEEWQAAAYPRLSPRTTARPLWPGCPFNAGRCDAH